MEDRPVTRKRQVKPSNPSSPSTPSPPSSTSPNSAKKPKQRPPISTAIQLFILGFSIVVVLYLTRHTWINSFSMFIIYFLSLPLPFRSPLHFPLACPIFYISLSFVLFFPLLPVHVCTKVFHVPTHPFLSFFHFRIRKSIY